MSVLDDAREIAEHDLKTLTVTGTMVCVFCGRPSCRPNCVRHALPKIIGVLEAAERVAQRYGTVYIEEQAEDIEALVAALEGDG